MVGPEVLALLSSERLVALLCELVDWDWVETATLTQRLGHPVEDDVARLLEAGLVRRVAEARYALTEAGAEALWAHARRLR